MIHWSKLYAFVLMGLKITAKTKLQIGHLLSVTQDSLKPLINNELIYNLKIINVYVYLSTKESDKLKFFFLDSA